MKNLFKYTLPVVALCALAACTDDDSVSAPVDINSGKEPIVFSKEDGLVTRASLTRAGFTSATLVKMRVMAEDATTPTPNKRYADATATAKVASNSSDSHTSNLTNATDNLDGSHSDLESTIPLLFWDDAFGTDSKLTVWALAIPNKNTASLIPSMATTGWSPIDGTLNPNWNTAASDIKTVTFSVNTAQTTTTMGNEDLAYSNNISTSGKGGRYYWDYVSGSDTWTLHSTMGDGRMIWTPKGGGKTGGKFDQGHLKFYHALSQLEINLREGSDFDNTASTDFQWTKNGAAATNPAQNITLNFYQTGTFDVSAGSWSGQGGSAITQSVVSTTTAGPVTEYKVNALVIPGNTLWESNDKFIEFEIDYGQYYVTGNQVATAIRAYATAQGAPFAFTTTAPGKKYIINLTVSKKKIEKITAAIVDWEEVNSNPVDADNTYPTFTFEDRRNDDERGKRLVGTTDNADDGDGTQFNIYRAAHVLTGNNYFTANNTNLFYDWQTGYGNTPATKSWDSADSEWATTDWYWPNNQTAYHFRAAGISGHTGSAPSMTISTDATPDPDVDYFAIGSGATNGTGSYQDYIWGAPFNQTIVGNGASVKYSTTSGFDANELASGHQILPAIAPMNEQINMVMFHMTSQITVNLTTTLGNEKVELRKVDDKGTVETSDDETTNTTVEIVNYYAGGKVLMGNGLVQTTGSTSTPTITTADDNSDPLKGYKAEVASTIPAKYMGYSYGVVPQSLTGVQLRITTPDGNRYYVNLDQVTASVDNSDIVNPYSGTAGNYTIDSWRPGFRYTYNITLKKKEIVKITAAVVDWETVTGNNINIDLEN